MALHTKCPAAKRGILYGWLERSIERGSVVSLLPGTARRTD